MHFFRSNRHFETCAPSSFRKYFATHTSVKLCPEELKSTFNYCDMPRRGGRRKRWTSSTMRHDERRGIPRGATA
eukprot:scaffold97532_cov27-Phaeocystis_antarctica.AAC.1